MKFSKVIIITVSFLSFIALQAKASDFCALRSAEIHKYLNLLDTSNSHVDGKKLDASSKVQFLRMYLESANKLLNFNEDNITLTANCPFHESTLKQELCTYVEALNVDIDLSISYNEVSKTMEKVVKKDLGTLNQIVQCK